MKKYFITVVVLFSILTLFFVIRRNYFQFNSIVSIKNTKWEKVHIQVRKGYNSDPANNKLIFDQSLTLGQSRTFTVDNGDDIVYRRDADPDNPDGKHFTEWDYANCDDSSSCLVEGP